MSGRWRNNDRNRREHEQEPERSAALGVQKRRVWFRPPGENKNERTGTIVRTEFADHFGIRYRIEDDRGYIYRLDPEAVLAPVETQL